MMSATEQAARLRAAADALDAEGKLEDELIEAKAARFDNPDDGKAKDRLDEAKRALVENRRERRLALEEAGQRQAPPGATVSIGGDAVQSNGNEG